MRKAWAFVLAMVWLGGCVSHPSPGPPVPTPTPIPPVTTTTTTTTTLPAAQCVNPTPGPVAAVEAKVHIYGANWNWIDATLLVGQRTASGPQCQRDYAYCAQIGFKDSRGYCSARMEGDPLSGVCDKLVNGNGIVWTWNGREIKPSMPGIPDDHEADIDPLGGWMLRVKPGKAGVARACKRVPSGCVSAKGARLDCGEVVLP